MGVLSPCLAAVVEQVLGTAHFSQLKRVDVVKLMEAKIAEQRKQLNERRQALDKAQSGFTAILGRFKKKGDGEINVLEEATKQHLAQIKAAVTTVDARLKTLVKASEWLTAYTFRVDMPPGFAGTISGGWFRAEA
jgi:hypothetical protein